MSCASSIPLLRRIREARPPRLVVWLLLAALILRGLMPLGFMLDTAGIQGGHLASLPVKICSSFGLKTVWLDQKTNKKPEQQIAQQHDCVLCAAPVTTTGLAPDNFLHKTLFAAIVLTFVAWLGATRHRYNAAAAPRAPPAFS